MKKVITLVSFIYFLIVGTHAIHAETLKVASIDWCPQLCPGEYSPGYVRDTVSMIFKDSPYQLSTKTYPWSRAIHLVKKGGAHALLSPARVEAPTLLYPKNEIGIQRMCFFTKADFHWNYSGVESLKGLEIGVATDTSIEELNSYIEQHKKRFQFMPYNDAYIGKSLKKLERDRIHTFLFTYNTAIYEMKKHKVNDKHRLAGCVSLAKIYMAFSPDPSQSEKIQEMMKYFDKKMDELRKSGQIAKIMSRYGLEDWQKHVK